MGKISAFVWEWPRGLAWRITAPFSLRSRRHKYLLFLREMQPTEHDTILDVGVTAGRDRGANFLEAWYPYRINITACGIEDLSEVAAAFPGIHTVRADGRKLPFKDKSFSIVFSNAVVEHVGTSREQAQFVAELCRVGKKVYCTTPNKWFPLEPHTLIPFAHWLPMRARNVLYRICGRGYWASEERLHPLGAREFLSFFENARRPAMLLTTRVLGIPATLIALVRP